MNERMRQLADEILNLQAELDREIGKRRREMGIHLRGKAIEFEQEILARHREMKQGIRQFLAESQLRNIMTAPIVYSLILPLLLIDLWATIYQHICFRIYGIPRVRRSRYVVIDRHKLSYLNGIEKLNCIYCGYGNGVIAYVREIAGRTEQYWCPIKHALRIPAPHDHYMEFLEYGDADGYRKQLRKFRDRLATLDNSDATDQLH